jgi:altronate dehydratase
MICAMSEHVDVDVSPIMRGEKSIVQSGEEIYRRLALVASGEPVKAELCAYDASSAIYTTGPII